MSVQNVPIASARIMLIRLPGKLVSKRALLVVADALTVLVTVVFVVVAAAFFGVDLAAATFFGGLVRSHSPSL